MRRLLPIVVLLVCAALLWAALPATDAFTDADVTALQTHNASWALNTNGFFYINTNAVYPFLDAGGVNWSFAHWSTDTFSNDQYSQVVVAEIQSYDIYMGPAVRVAAVDATGYGVYFYTGHLVLCKVVAGTQTDIHDEAMVVSVSDVIRLEASGTTITVKINGSAAFHDHTDSDIASGYAGLIGHNRGTTSRVDDWEGGDLAATASPRRQIRIIQ